MSAPQPQLDKRYDMTTFKDELASVYEGDDVSCAVVVDAAVVLVETRRHQQGYVCVGNSLNFAMAVGAFLVGARGDTSDAGFRARMTIQAFDRLEEARVHGLSDTDELVASRIHAVRGELAEGLNDITLL